MIKPQTLKGFRDFLPNEVKKRQYVIRQLAEVFESYGFEPLETPALEYEEILMGKYGEEGDKLMYRFVDNGGRRVALRYDQTVPLARVVAQYQNTLSMPFKRYQIQNVYRADNPQKGRFREFLQCDIDTVGIDTPLCDTEVIVVAAKALEKLGFKNYKVLINDRSIFKNIPKEAIVALDKLKKIGQEGVIEEFVSKGMTKEKAITTLQCVVGMQETERLRQIFSLIDKYGLKQNQNFIFAPTLARGLDYYTGLIFEVEIEEYAAGSVAGGGRYDNLIGMFADRNIPAVGFSFGFGRLMEAMEKLNLFPKDLKTTKVLVTIFSKKLIQKSIDISLALHMARVSTELYLDENTKLEKQLKYADQKGIPYVVIIGPDEAKNNTVTLKNLTTKTQKTTDTKQLLSEIK